MDRVTADTIKSLRQRIEISKQKIEDGKRESKGYEEDICACHGLIEKLMIIGKEKLILIGREEDGRGQGQG